MTITAVTQSNDLVKGGVLVCSSSNFQIPQMLVTMSDEKSKSKKYFFSDKIVKENTFNLSPGSFLSHVLGFSTHVQSLQKKKKKKSAHPPSSLASLGVFGLYKHEVRINPRQGKDAAACFSSLIQSAC